MISARLRASHQTPRQSSEEPHTCCEDISASICVTGTAGCAAYARRGSRLGSKAVTFYTTVPPRDSRYTPAYVLSVHERPSVTGDVDGFPDMSITGQVIEVHSREGGRRRC